MVHVAVLLGIELTADGTDTVIETKPERARAAAWEDDALRVIELREPTPSAPEAEAPARVATSGGNSAPTTPPLPASLEGAAPGSEAAAAALGRFASLGIDTDPAPVAAADGNRGRSAESARARREAPPAYYDGRAEFRPASRAAREADRDGRSPDLGGDAVAVSNRGLIVGR